MKFLNGYKTILGIVGTVATVLISSGGNVGHIGQVVVDASQHVDAILGGAFGLLTVLGIIHKKEKAKS